MARIELYFADGGNLAFNIDGDEGMATALVTAIAKGFAEAGGYWLTGTFDLEVGETFHYMWIPAATRVRVSLDEGHEQLTLN